MSYLKENLNDCIFDLDEAIVFIVKIMDSEIDHDPELVREAEKHIKSLAHLHSAIKEEGQAV